MSAALDAVKIAVGRANGCDVGPPCDFHCDCMANGMAALRAFLDFVENSQQPISHDAMQTLRAHLGEQARDGG